MALMVRHPFTQTVLAKMATTYLSRNLQTEVNIHRLEITSFKSISFDDVLIKDLRNDTLLYTGQLSVQFKNYNFKNAAFDIENIGLENADISLRKLKESQELNLKFIVDYFKKQNTQETPGMTELDIDQQKKELLFSLDKLSIINSRFKFENQTKQRKHSGIDFIDINVFIENFEATNAIIQNDTLTVDIHQIALYEHSGFQVDSLSCQFKISPEILLAKNLLLLTPKNDIDLDLTFSYKSFKDYKDFLEKIKIQSDIRPSTINLSEVGYFAPVMFAMDNRLKISGDIKGTVDNFKAKDFKFAYGSTTQFRGNVQMNGLPNIKETYSHLSIKDFFTTVVDVRQLNLPMPGSNIKLPEILARFGGMKIKGKFTGFYNDFVSYASFKTDIGQVSTDILLRVNEYNDVEYLGNISANDFHSGKFFGIENNLQRLDLIADISGSGLSLDNMQISMEGLVDSLEFHDNIYNEIIISGNLNDQKFTGNIDVKDELGYVDFNGIVDFSQNIPQYNFTAGIKDAKLQKINLVHRDTSMTLSTYLNINLIGDQLDNMQGIIKIDSTRYYERGEFYSMNDFTLSVTRDASNFSLIRLFSDFVDATFEGQFHFMDLPSEVNKIGNLYLNSLFPDSTYVDSTLNRQDFIFDIELKNTSSLAELFVPDLIIEDGSWLTGGYNSRIIATS